MTERAYLFFLGLCLLLALYIESSAMLYGIVIFVFFEGVTSLSIPKLSQKLMHTQLDPGLLQYAKEPKFNFDAFRMLRIVFSTVVFLSYVAVHEYNIDMLWFFPWFLAFAVLGAGVSGVCPVYLAMRWIGFK